jgi:hypothetical protein
LDGLTVKLALFQTVRVILETVKASVTRSKDAFVTLVGKMVVQTVLLITLDLIAKLVIHVIAMVEFAQVQELMVVLGSAFAIMVTLELLVLNVMIIITDPLVLPVHNAQLWAEFVTEEGHMEGPGLVIATLDSQDLLALSAE